MFHDLSEEVAELFAEESSGDVREWFGDGFSTQRLGSLKDAEFDALTKRLARYGATRRWRAAHPEHARQISREWKRKHRAQIAAYFRNRYQNDPKWREHVKAYVLSRHREAMKDPEKKRRNQEASRAHYQRRKIDPEWIAHHRAQAAKYRAEKRARKIAALGTTACRQCGQKFPTPYSKGQPKVFCGKACRVTWHNSQRDRKGKAREVRDAE